MIHNLETKIAGLTAELATYRDEYAAARHLILTQPQQNRRTTS
jgi:hypothetical protein